MKTTEKLMEAVRAMRCLDAMGRDLVEAPEEHRPVIQARIDSIHRAAEEALFAASRATKPEPTTCSECSGPLNEEAGYGPGGKATCEACAEKADAEAAEAAEERLREKKYRGNVCAEERAIDAGLREAPYTAIGGAS